MFDIPPPGPLAMRPLVIFDRLVVSNLGPHAVFEFLPMSRPQPLREL